MTTFASIQTAIAAYRDGNYKRAVELCTAVLKRDPKAHSAYNVLALSENRRGRSKPALRAINKALELAPRLAGYHNNLGEIQRNIGDADAALRAYRNALKYDPKHPGAMANLGIVLAQHKQLDDAEKYLRAALALNPDLIEAQYNLGLIALTQGHAESAESAFQHILRNDPTNPDALNQLALLQTQRGDHAASYQHFTRILESNPNDCRGWAGILNSYRQTGQIERAAKRLEALPNVCADDIAVLLASSRVLAEHGELSAALARLQRAHTLMPDDPLVQRSLGDHYLSRGAAELAEQAYRRCLTLDPQDVGTLIQLVRSRRITATDDADVTALTRARERDDLSDAERIAIEFALGKAYEDLRQYPQAFAHFRAGNERRAKRQPFNLDAHRRLFNCLKRRFPGGRTKPATPAHITAPIFVVGMPRSGTTLVHQILAAHPAITGAGELNTLNIALASACGFTEQSDLADGIAALDSRQIIDIGNRYRRDTAHFVSGDGTTRWIVDKMPQNFRYLGLIREALPEAVLILCQRDPRDTALSIYKQNFSGHHDYAYRLEDIGHYWREYRALMIHWQATLGDALHVVDYESLTASPETGIAGLLNHCGLDVDPACLNFHRGDTAVHTASITQVRQPIHRNSVAAWRRYERELAPFIRALGDDSTGTDPAT